MGSQDFEKREKLLVGFINEKFRREAARNRQNDLKITVQWQALLREAKTEELKADLRMLGQTFQCQLDYKDEMVGFLTAQLDEMELKYVRAVCDHMVNTEKLVGKQEKRVDLIRAQYLRQTNEVKEMYLKDGENLEESQEAGLEDLRELSRHHKGDFESKERHQQATFLTLRDEVKEEGADDRRQMRQHMERDMNKIWARLQDAFRLYSDNTWELSKAYLDAKKMDDHNRTLVLNQKRKIAMITQTIKRTRKKIVETKLHYKEKNDDLKDEMNKVVKYTQAMTKAMNEGNRSSEKEVRVLVMRTIGTLYKLRKYKKMGETILNAYECCHRLETSKEQVLPFYHLEYSMEEKEIVREAEKIHIPQNFPKDKIREYPLLSEFWKRFSKAAIETLALQKEVHDLEDENRILRKRLSLFHPDVDRLMALKSSYIRTIRTRSCKPTLDYPKCKDVCLDNSVDTKQVIKNILDF